jgi:cytochrome bd-type quinol oxidase subunit 2
MTYSIPPAPCPPASGPTIPARRRDGGRIALGSTQIALSLLVGLFWFALGAGVAMCTDAGPAATCDRIFGLWGLTGLTLLLSMLGGAALTVTSRGAPDSRWRTATAWFAGLTALAVIVVGMVFWSAASAPLNG